MKLEKDYKRKLQLKILDIVKDIDDVCKKNNIEYYILYGSALGAIRHKGFIPWDDDFDIGMTYDNYVKFLEVCEQQLDKNKYYVQTPDKEEDYYLSFSKPYTFKRILSSLVSIFSIIFGIFSLLLLSEK